MLACEHFLPCIFPEHVLCFPSAQIYCCLHVFSRSYWHDHVMCPFFHQQTTGFVSSSAVWETSFSSSVMNISNEYFQVTGIVSTASYRSRFQFQGCAAVSLGEQMLLFCHTAFILSVKQSKKNVWLWRWRHYNPSGATCPTTQCHIPEDLHCQQHCCDNLKALLHNVL
jgi:hypothetical protein